MNARDTSALGADAPSDVGPGTGSPAPNAAARAERVERRSGAGTRLQRVAVAGLFGLALVAALYFARPLLLPIIIAVLLSLLLSPLVGLLERIRVPRAAAAVVTVFSCLAVVWYLGSYLYAPAQQWLDTAPAQIDELREKFRVLLHPVERMQSATEKVAEAAKPNNANPPPREVVVERQSLLGLLNDTQAFVVGTLATLILLFFLLASGDLFLRKLIRVIPRFSDKIVAVEITRTIQHQIGRYFLGATMINIVLGIVVTGAMMLLGMPTPALLGTIAALLNFIPYIGSGLMLVITAIVAVITFDTVSEMLLPPLVFLVLTTIEGQVVQPIVHGRRLNSTPVVLFTWVLFWGWLWGVGGVAVAVPLLVALKICAEHIPSWAPIAEFLGGEAARETDRSAR